MAKEQRSKLLAKELLQMSAKAPMHIDDQHIDIVDISHQSM
jgi:hypothetical protein